MNAREAKGDAFTVRPCDTILYREEFSGAVKRSRLKYKSPRVRWRQSGGKRPAGKWHPPKSSWPHLPQRCFQRVLNLVIQLSSGQQFPITTDLFAHPMSIYWLDRLFSKMHYASSNAGAPKATGQQTS